MKTSFVKTAVALALGSVSLLSQAATVTLTGWAEGSGNSVTVGVPNHTGPAGGFTGKVEFSGNESGFSGTFNDFITYCVEIDQTFGLSTTGMTGYSVVAGENYDLWNSPNPRNSNPGQTATKTAERLGKLLTYVGSDNTLVDDAAESTSLQLAIWNIIYDNDADLDGGVFMSTGAGSARNPYAETLLLDSVSVTSLLDVFVLTRDNPKSQDFLLTREREVPPSDVPEPASLALSLLGLAAAGVVSRRRRQRV